MMSSSDMSSSDMSLSEMSSSEMILVDKQKLAIVLQYNSHLANENIKLKYQIKHEQERRQFLSTAFLSVTGPMCSDKPQKSFMIRDIIGTQENQSRNPCNYYRGNSYPEWVTKILEDWLKEHIDYPYPSDAEKQKLSFKTGLNKTQVSNWFMNVRKRRNLSKKNN